MAFVKGERVYFDFETGGITSAEGEVTTQYPEEDEESAAPAPASMSMVSDIMERAPSATNPPVAPTFKPNTTGFPAHKKRANRVSAFKQQRTGRKEASFTSHDHDAPKKPAVTGEANVAGVDKTERERIDEENNERLAAMTEEEIAQEQQDLMSNLSPALIQRLLARGNIDEGSNEQDWDKIPEPKAPEPPAVAPLSDDAVDAEISKLQTQTTTNKKKVTFEDVPDEEPSTEHNPTHQHNHTHPSGQQETLLDDLPENLPTDMHFPRPTQPPDLDPNSPSFLKDMHTKYFPNMPYDPSALSWMSPIDPSDKSSPYHPSQTAYNANELRFNFKGGLLAPSAAREIPVTEGLHHHAEAPEAAGYTIPELARLARSAVAAQRCVAYQTLGRILYRLGKGEYGTEKGEARVEGPVQVASNGADDEEKEEADVADDIEDASSAMATGLWKCIEEGKVIESLTEEAAKERGHLSARTYAQEALWNWRRGGGRKRKAV